MTEKSTDEDDDGWNDNYDGNDDNIDDKNVQKTHKYYDFWVKFTDNVGCWLGNFMISEWAFECFDPADIATNYAWLVRQHPPLLFIIFV